MIIFISELLAVIALAAQHGHLWSGAAVAALIDNDNANIAFGTRKSKSRYVRWLLLILTALEFRLKFRLVEYYANTHSNWLLDRIGRYDIFEDLSDSEAQAELQNELMDRYLPGFTFEEMTALLDFFSKGASVEKSFVLPGGSLDVGVELLQEPQCSRHDSPTDQTNECANTVTALDEGRGVWRVFSRGCASEFISLVLHRAHALSVPVPASSSPVCGAGAGRDEVRSEPLAVQEKAASHRQWRPALRVGGYVRQTARARS